MFYASSSILLALAMSKQILGASIISPPSLVTCQPIAITYDDAPAGDVFISVIKGGDPSSPALVDLGKHSGPSGKITWIVNLAAETGITLKLVDKDGQIAFSAPVDIQSGSDSSCIAKPADVVDAPSKEGDGSSSSSLSSSSSSASDSKSATASSSAASTAVTVTLSSTPSSTPGTTSLPSSTDKPFEGSSAGFSSSIAGQPGAGFASFTVSMALVAGTTLMVTLASMAGTMMTLA